MSAAPAKISWPSGTLQANKFYTLYGVEFVDYDEKLYRALVASGASNGRVDIDDVKLGPL